MDEFTRKTVMGGIDKFKQYFKFDEDYKWRLILAAIVNNKFLEHTKPLIFLEGRHDSGKTTRGSFMIAIMNDDMKYGVELIRDPIVDKSGKQIVDARTGELEWTIKQYALSGIPLMAPENAEDFLLFANNRKSLLFDNIDQTDSRTYNAICMLATGGGVAKRKLYSNASTLEVGKMVTTIYTGIRIVMARRDVISRHIIIRVPPFHNDKVNERILRKKFCEDLSILRGTIEEIYNSIKNGIDLAAEQIQIPDEYRLSSYALVGILVNQLLGEPDFLLDYKQALDIGNGLKIADTTENGILEFIKTRITSNGMELTTKDLLNEISAYNPELGLEINTPHSLGQRLTDMENDIRAAGFYITKRRTADGSTWRITKMKKAYDGNVTWEEKEEQSNIPLKTLEDRQL